MQVTVEGVETENQATLVRNLDADHVQGLYYGKPLPASELGPTILAELHPETAPAKDDKPAALRKIG
jgi:EAL domain-containing protein (putative c-di-GMP-specific phosphodiesterase class I)